MASEKPQNKKGDEKLPLSLKLKAWWNGYDPSDLAAGPKETASSRPSQLVQEARAQAAEKITRPDMPWDAARAEISQLVWGDGFCGPGGPDHVINMVKLLVLTPEKSMVDIGAGLGGPARAIAQTYGIWITGYEHDPELAAAGNELSVMAGLTKKAPVKHYDFDKPTAFERHFDRALAKESLFTIRDKRTLFGQIESSLKDNGLFLITDYVAANDQAAASPAFADWCAHEPVEPHPATLESLVADLESVRLGIRVNEDVSEHYAHLISRSWADADQIVAKLIKRGKEGLALVDVLLREAEMWTRRAKLLRSGELRVQRILAHKQAPSSQLMSDP